MSFEANLPKERTGLAWASIIVGAVCLPLALIACWWTLAIRSFDIGENDFAGLFFVVVEAILLLVVCPAALATVGLGAAAICRTTRRGKALFGLGLGLLCAVVILYGFVGPPRPLFG